ncbi:MAG TPA: pitrilysin family protein [Candidatus Acidoferrales bacterium]|nr:pitrilysin family protein [Candidatus Acidoferrales bacterium]
MVRRVIFLLAILLVTYLASGQAASNSDSKSKPKHAPVASASRIKIPDIAYEKYKLKNGLEVILSENHRLPIVAVNIWYHVGPANERPGRTGFAHLFEHLMFEGSKHVGEKAHFRYLEAAGGANINGTTEFDRTNYFETVPSNELEKALWLESDRMGFLLDTLTEAKLANQRDVVRNERRQRVENDPYGLADEALFQALFPAEHPYHGHVIGSHADIEAAQLNDVREFFHLYYAPNNASLVIAGDINKARTKELVEKYFGPLPSGPPVPVIKVKTPHITQEKRLVITDKVGLPRVYIAWITDPIFKPGDAAEQLLGRILGGGRSRASRLFQHLVHDKQIAQDVHAEQYTLALGSVFFIQVTAKRGITPEQIEAAVDEELSNVREHGVTQAELDRERNVVEARMLRKMDKLGGQGGVADRLNLYNHYLGDPGFLQKDIDRYEQVSTSDLQRVAQDKLTRNSRVVVYCIPGEKVVHDVARIARSEEPAQADEKTKAFEEAQAWRAQAPQSGPSSNISLPSPHQFKLANGLTVLLVEKHDLPLITAELTVIGGSGANPPDRPGLALFTANMLEAGTKTRSNLQIAIDADKDGAEIESTSDSDRSAVSISCLKQHLNSAFDLLSDVVLNPAFAPEEIERVRKESISSLQQDGNSSRTTALRIFQQVLYGKENPYGYTALGSEESLKTLQRMDIVNFWRSTYVPGNAVLAIAGDITQNQAQLLAKKYFGQWKGTPNLGPPPSLKGMPGRKVLIINKPGAAQSSVLVGGTGIAHSSPDYIAVDVMNTILGGLFSSRLNMNLRERHGYCYGAFSQFTDRRGTGAFYARAEVRADVTAPAVGEILSELNKISLDPLSADEVRTGRDSISRSLSSLFETSARTSQSLSDLFVYGLPLDYYAKLPVQINKVTPDIAAKIAGKYIHPDEMTVVVVGDSAKIEPALKKLKLGPIQVLDPQGNMQASR